MTWYTVDIEYIDDPESNTHEDVTFDELAEWVKPLAVGFGNLFELVVVQELERTTVKAHG
jgi:hypothetical protein